MANLFAHLPLILFVKKKGVFILNRGYLVIFAILIGWDSAFPQVSIPDSIISATDSMGASGSIFLLPPPNFDSASIPDTARSSQTNVEIPKMQSQTVLESPPAYQYEILVVGAKPKEYTPSKAVLDAKDFAGKYQDLQAVLQTVSGVTVRNLGGFGHYAEASIRGSSSNQVQVYLDNIPLNGSAGSSVDLSKIPVATLQKIVLYKNTPSIEYFGDNAGGVILLTSDSKKEVKRATLEAGSFGYRKGDAMMVKETGPYLHRFSLDCGVADNSYPYMNNNGTTLGQNAKDDDVLKSMDNNHFSSFSSSYSNTWDPKGTSKLHSKISIENTAEGIFYFPDADSNDGSIKSSTISLLESFESFINPEMFVRFTGKARLKDELFQRIRPFYLYTSAVKNTIRQPYASLDGMSRIKFGNKMTFTGILSGSYSGFFQDNLFLEDEMVQPYFFRFTGKAGLEAEMELHENLGGRLGGMARYEFDSANGSFYYGGFRAGGKSTAETFPGGFAEINYKPYSGLTLLASFRRSGRSPGFSEKFSQGANYSGNASLRPETRTEYELGFSINKAFAALSLSLFKNITRDKIIFMMNAQRMFIPQNMNQVAGIGLESEISVAPFEWIRIINSALYMVNIVHSDIANWDGNEEPLLPRFSDDLDVKLICSGLYASHRVHFSSPYFLGLSNIDQVVQKLPEMDIQIGFQDSEHFDISYRLENYLNVQNFDFRDRQRPGIKHYVVWKSVF